MFLKITYLFHFKWLLDPSLVNYDTVALSSKMNIII